jgi:hypothetical protein
LSSVVQLGNLRPALITGAVVQVSTNSTVVASGSELDVTQYGSLAYTIVVATNDVKWTVFAANVSDYSDEVIVNAATNVVAGTNSSYSVGAAPFRFYRVKIIDNVGGTHGTATINGVGK